MSRLQAVAGWSSRQPWFRISQFFIRIVRLVFADAVTDVLYRRGNHISAAGPFTEIDQPAALAAKGEVLAVTLDRLFTRGTFGPRGTFARHTAIVDATDDR